VALVEEHADEICDRWMEAILHSPTTPSYGRPDLTELQAAAHTTLSHFCAWLLEEDRDTEAEAFYFEIGRRRATQGFRLWEVVSAVTLLRREVWTFARERQVLDSTMDVYGVMELSRRLVLFFDKALFHAARGYLEVQQG
jgi:hypothetical protein